MSDRCVYHPAWSDRGASTDTVNGFCAVHTGKRCAGCGAIADRECNHTFQFVCGSPLCPQCGHTYRGNTTESTGHGRPGWLNGKRVEASDV